MTDKCVRVVGYVLVSYILFLKCHSVLTGLVGAILYTVTAAFLQEALHAFLKLQELKLLTR